MPENRSSGSVRGRGVTAPTYSAQRVIANAELARTIEDDHRVPEQALVAYGTAERGLGGSFRVIPLTKPLLDKGRKCRNCDRPLTDSKILPDAAAISYGWRLLDYVCRLAKTCQTNIRF